MNLKRAQEIVKDMAHTAMVHRGIIAPPYPDLSGYSLREMLAANKIVDRHNNRPGNSKIQIICDDRLIAALYALDHFPPDETNAIIGDAAKALVILDKATHRKLLRDEDDAPDPYDYGYMADTLPPRARLARYPVMLPARFWIGSWHDIPGFPDDVQWEPARCPFCHAWPYESCANGFYAVGCGNFDCPYMPSVAGFAKREDANCCWNELHMIHPIDDTPAWMEAA